MASTSCVCVIPSLTSEQTGSVCGRHVGTLTLDGLTRNYTKERLEYQFAIVAGSAEADALERSCRDGSRFGVRPYPTTCTDHNGKPSTLSPNSEVSERLVNWRGWLILTPEYCP